jgi:hypothetical protein
MCLQDLHDLVEDQWFAKSRYFLRLDTTAWISLRPLFIDVENTDVCKSLAAFFASTVLPKSVVSFSMRAFTGSLSVMAALTSGFRFQVISSDFVTHGVICDASAAVSNSKDQSTHSEQLLELQRQTKSQRFTCIVGNTIPAMFQQNLLPMETA